MTEPLRLSHFREYAQAVAVLKARAKDESPETVRNEVLALLDQQERLDAHPEPDYHYALAAFADEAFLSLDWPGRTEWRARLMETQRFGSRAAGERVFTKIDELADGDAAAAAPLAAVYLLMLGLGFRGRFRLAGQEAQIEQRRARLWAMIERYQPGLLAGTRWIAPDAYANTIQEGPVLTLASPARWWAAVAAVALVWLLGSAYAWWQLSDPVTAQIHTVERKLAEEGPRR